MASSSILSIKAKLGNDIRRFSLDQASFSDLNKSLHAIFAVAEQVPIIIKYQDDEQDLITLSSQPELTSALHLLTPGQVLRLEIELGSPTKTSTNTAKCEGCESAPKSCCGNGAQEKCCGQGSHQHAPFWAFHPRMVPMGGFHKQPHCGEPPLRELLSRIRDCCAICDGCAGFIVEDRYKCTTCADYELCKECISKEGIHDPAHKFQKKTNKMREIYDQHCPEPLRAMMRDALRDCCSSASEENCKKCCCNTDTAADTACCGLKKETGGTATAKPLCDITPEEAEALKVMAEMGFKDQAINLEVLRNVSKGNLVDAINALTNGY